MIMNRSAGCTSSSLLRMNGGISVSELFDRDGADLFTLEDEDGVEQQFQFIDEYEENGIVYYALVPYDENAAESLDSDGELVVLKLENENGEDILSTIDDDDEYDRIGNIFMNRIQDDYDSDENGGN